MTTTTNAKMYAVYATDADARGAIYVQPDGTIGPKSTAKTFPPTLRGGSEASAFRRECGLDDLRFSCGLISR